MDSINLFSGALGIFIGVALLFVSIVWIIFPFIVMNRLSGIREKLESGNLNMLALIQGTAKSNELLAKMIASAVPATTLSQRAAMPAATAMLHISKEGEDLGRMDMSSVRTLLKRGELSLQDYYYDDEINEWVTLDCHLKLC